MTTGKPRVETHAAQIGPRGVIRWFVYVDGEMLRGKNGVGRMFQTEAAARRAGAKATSREVASALF